MLAIWSPAPLPFLNPAWTSGSSRFKDCWSLAWRILSITLLAFSSISYPWWKECYLSSATGRNIFHTGISSPAFKKKKEEFSLPQRQHTSHCLQPIRSHNLELLFSIELLFKIALPNFLLKSNNSKPLSFVSWTCLWFTIGCLNQIQFSAISK